MADPIGEFSLKHTGSAYAKTENGELANTSNWQGTATGYGTVFGTLSLSQPLAEAGATSRSCSWAGQGFSEDGTTLGAPFSNGVSQCLPARCVLGVVVLADDDIPVDGDRRERSIWAMDPSAAQVSKPVAYQTDRAVAGPSARHRAPSAWPAKRAAPPRRGHRLRLTFCPSSTLGVPSELM